MADHEDIKRGSKSDFSFLKERIFEAAVNPFKVVYIIIRVKDFVYLVVDYKHYEDTFQYNSLSQCSKHPFKVQTK